MPTPLPCLGCPSAAPCPGPAQSRAHTARKSGRTEVGALGTLTRLFSSAPPGIYKGHCFRINHFPEDNDYDHDSSEYLLRECQDPASPCVWDGGLEEAGAGGRMGPMGAEGPASGCSRHSPLTQDPAFRGVPRSHRSPPCSYWLGGHTSWGWQEGGASRCPGLLQVAGFEGVDHNSWS